VSDSFTGCPHLHLAHRGVLGLHDHLVVDDLRSANISGSRRRAGEDALLLEALQRLVTREVGEGASRMASARPRAPPPHGASGSGVVAQVGGETSAVQTRFQGRSANSRRWTATSVLRLVGGVEGRTQMGDPRGGGPELAEVEKEWPLQVKGDMALSRLDSTTWPRPVRARRRGPP